MRLPVIALLALACVAGVSAKTLWHQLDSTYSFETYCSEFSKNYAVGSAEYDLRKGAFDANLRAVLAHNADNTRTWKVMSRASQLPWSWEGITHGVNYELNLVFESEVSAVFLAPLVLYVRLSVMYGHAANSSITYGPVIVL